LLIATPTVAVVTGAAGLIGQAVVEELSSSGSRVVALDKISVDTGGAEMITTDITRMEDVAAAATLVASRYGRVDHLIHAAAITARTQGVDVRADLVDVDVATWQSILDANLTGALICVKAFVNLLRCSQAPKVLMVGSIQGIVPTLGTGVYGVTKAALAALTRQLAAELAFEGITVNMLAPGPISDDGAETARHLPGPTPMGRFGRPNEVARAVASMLSDSFSYMTGAVVPYDGGEHLRPRGNPVRTNGTKVSLGDVGSTSQ
jgi:NAD(P)-dependent dehydrogenase (short-subunit alcohol dehydrogenase family)